jgi:2-polyprenyl-6-methoxyphenol hydroxylase-like FAD-dependent oxidoreductase
MEAIMAETFKTDVLICGGGAAGLTLAIDLARRGVAFRLIDKIEGPFPGSRGKGIQPRSQEVFEDLGVIDQMWARGGLYPPTRTYRDGGSVDEPMMEQGDPTPAEPYVRPLMLPQNLTECVLRERLAEFGHAPEFGCEMIGFEQDAEGVRVRLSKAGAEEILSVRYLVGADGGRSFVRHALAIDFPGKMMPVRAIVADLVLEGLNRDAWRRWGRDLGQISLCPLAGTDLIQLQAPVSLDADADISDAEIAAMIAERTGRSDLVLKSVVWRSVYSMSARLADRYRVGRVFLAGDAAHIHPPTGGQGLNTSVQDAYNLGWKLAAVLGGAPETLLDSYEAERRPIAAEMLGMATSLLKAAHERGDMRRGRETHQLDLGYEGSALCLELRAGERPLRPGDRAPDAPCSDADGRVVRLFDVFAGPHWTLLVQGGPAPSITTRPGLKQVIIGLGGDLADSGGHFGDAYGLAPGQWMMIRPDGYVGAAGGGGDAAALQAYLAGVGLVPARAEASA